MQKEKTFSILLDDQQSIFQSRILPLYEKKKIENSLNKEIDKIEMECGEKSLKIEDSYDEEEQKYPDKLEEEEEEEDESSSIILNQIPMMKKLSTR